MKKRWNRAERRRWEQRQRDEDAALAAANPPFQNKPRVFKLLTVSNEFLTAQALFHRRDGYFWSLAKCAPVLNWMQSVPIDNIPLELLKRGCRWQWSVVVPDKQPISFS